MALNPRHSFLRTLLGVIWRFGKGGPQVKNNAGVLENRDATDSDFAIMRGKDPVANNDFATKGWVGTPGSPNGSKWVAHPITTTASTDSTKLIPANSKILRRGILVETPYDNGATLQLGYTGTLNAIFDTGDSDLSVAGLWQAEDYSDWNGTAIKLTATIANSPTVGAGTCLVEYVETPDA